MRVLMHHDPFIYQPRVYSTREQDGFKTLHLNLDLDLETRIRESRDLVTTTTRLLPHHHHTAPARGRERRRERRRRRERGRRLGFLASGNSLQSFASDLPGSIFLTEIQRPLKSQIDSPTAFSSLDSFHLICISITHHSCRRNSLMSRTPLLSFHKAAHHQQLYLLSGFLDHLRL
ncbi:hypothetical protein YC2023_052241 [Brassica napus]